MAVTCGYGEELSGSINARNFLTSDKVYWLASQEGLCSMEQVSKDCESTALDRTVALGIHFQSGPWRHCRSTLGAEYCMCK